MKYYFVIALWALSSQAVPSVSAQQADMQMKMSPPERPATLISGLGAVHHPVSTKNPEAPRFFDQGLALIYGFNHDEVLLRHGNYIEAEKVFRADLERNGLNGRSLFGLMETLKAQKKEAAAANTQRELKRAWKNSDIKLTLQDLW